MTVFASNSVDDGSGLDQEVLGCPGRSELLNPLPEVWVVGRDALRQLGEPVAGPAPIRLDLRRRVAVPFLLGATNLDQPTDAFGNLIAQLVDVSGEPDRPGRRHENGERDREGENAKRCAGQASGHDRPVREDAPRLPTRAGNGHNPRQFAAIRDTMRAAQRGLRRAFLTLTPPFVLSMPRRPRTLPPSPYQPRDGQDHRD